MMSTEQDAATGIGFELTEEMRLLRQTAREFAEREIRPHVMKLDEAQEFPAEIFRKMAELGFLGATIPTELEGGGLTAREFVVIMEEVSRIDPSVGLTLAAHSGLCLQHISLFANDRQRRKYVPDLATGRIVGSWCLTEPGSGSDAGGMQTNAVLKGDTYVLNGTKNFITNGSHAQTFVVTAKTDQTKGKSGISAFIVEKSFGGISVGKKENKLGMRASDTVQLNFDNVPVPRENLLGDPGDGFKQALTVLDSGRIGIAALSTGLAQGALDAAVKYAKERKQFGQAIAEFQGIQFPLAEIGTEIEAARLLTYRAADAKARGKVINLLAAQAKLFASEAA
ncbi:MAG TPA: acyl-CoA dehydrogenase family protein, partial [Bacteroidota bacterium]|nr:acyl-CoA dehydrogenase family protein [Bacteroidota bacterium]